MTTDGPVVLRELARALRNLAAAWEAEREQAAADLVALKRAKEENDERFMTERDAARAEAARLDKQNWNLCARINASEYARMTAEAETARWKYETRKYTCRCSGDDHHDGCTYATIAAALRGPAQSEKP